MPFIKKSCNVCINQITPTDNYPAGCLKHVKLYCCDLKHWDHFKLKPKKTRYQEAQDVKVAYDYASGWIKNPYDHRVDALKYMNRALSSIMTKEKTMKDFHVFTPFSIKDIYKQEPCKGEFLKLLAEKWLTTGKFKNADSVKTSPTLMRNLAWLEEKGFIKEKKEDWWINIFLTKENLLTTKTAKFATKEIALMALNGSPNGERYITTVKLN